MQNHQDNTKRIAKNTMYMFIRMILIMCVSIFTSRIILDTLGVADYGIYNIVGSVVVFLSFFKIALNNATYRFLTFELGRGDYNKLSQIFIMAVNLHVILAILLWLILEIVGVWFLNTHLNIPDNRIEAANYVFHLSLLTFVVEIIKTPYNSAIISHEKMSFYSYTSIVEALLKLAIVCILYFVEYDKLVLYAFLILLISVLMFIWYFIYCQRCFSETHYYLYWDSKLLNKLASYSGWSLLGNCADIVVHQTINFLFNIFGGVVANASMAITNQVNGVLTNFLSSFTTAYNPQIIKSYAQNDMKYFMNLIITSSKVSYYLLFGLVFPILLNIDFILELWIVEPPQFTSDFIVYMLIYSLIDAVSAPLWNAVYATGNIRNHQILMFVIKILNIPLGYILLSNDFSLCSVIALYAALNFVCCVVRAIYMRRLIGLSLKSYFIDVLLRVFFVSFISSLLPLYCFIFHLDQWSHLFISFICFYLPYIIIVYYCGLSKVEKSLLLSILRKKKLFIKKKYV